jgi:hypothetical protein
LLRARAFADGLTPSPIAASLVYDIFARAAMPDILPRGPGPFVTSVTVTLKATTASIIYYTLDGSDPVAGTSEVYKAPILINSFTTTAVKALASKPGFADSLVSSASYLVLEQVVAPVIHVEGGPTFTQSAKFLISCATDGAVIHYTLDGSDPTAASPAYNEGGLLVALEPGDLAARVFSVKAIAIKAPSMGDSAVVSAGPFRVQPQVAAPIIAPDSSGPFLDSVLVSMTCSTPSASIYYTTDGSAPLVSPTAAVYTKPLALKGLYPATNAVVAVATKFGFTPSASVTASWIVETQACRPVINLAAGTYIAGVPVSISCAGTAPIGTVRYTIDGASPDAAAALTYAGPFPLDQPGTYVVRAVAIGDHLFSSPTVLSGEIEVREDPSCQANFYSDQRQTASDDFMRKWQFADRTCLPCPTGGVSLAASVGLLSCKSGPGYIGPDGGAFSPCPRGTYKLDSKTCTPCPTGGTTLEIGSNSNLACIANIGYQGPPGGDFELCPIASYSDETGLTSCKSCGIGGTTLQVSTLETIRLSHHCLVLTQAR